MEQSTFWKLYDNGEIDVKVYIIDNTERAEDYKSDELQFAEISAFEYDDKFYLRIYTRYPRYICDRTRSNGIKYRMGHDYCYIKEFNTRSQANNYFKKVVDGYEYHRA